MSEKEQDLCNLCGLSINPAESSDNPLHHDFDKDHCALQAKVMGGYFSTAGNGYGALDDTTAYEFCLCEFCLDWLFSKFKLPVKLSNYMQSQYDDSEYDCDPSELHPVKVWRPAKQRVEEDGWRSYKEEWFKIYNEREGARPVK
jgi:hypothetical protein